MKVENTIGLNKNYLFIFLFIMFLYYLMTYSSRQIISYPSVLMVTQDSLCINPEGWPIPCPE